MIIKVNEQIYSWDHLKIKISSPTIKIRGAISFALSYWRTFKLNGITLCQICLKCSEQSASFKGIFYGKNQICII